MHIFSSKWWLDAVTSNGHWKEIIVEKGGDIVARMPYFMKRKFGLTYLTMPPLTQTLGPWIKHTKINPRKQVSQQNDLMTKLIEQIPSFDLFQQNFHFSFNNWLPFYWKGFKQTTRYTYVLEDLSNIDKVWDNFSISTRKSIRDATKRFNLKICTDYSIDIFFDIHEMTFKRQGIISPYSRNLVKRLDNACEAQNARRIFFAIDPDGFIHAAVYVVWDKNSAYYLMGGADPNLRHTGGTSLCMWEAIKFLSTIVKTVDFEGSMIESIERYFRGLGAVQKPYFQISAMSNRMRFLIGFKEMLMAVKRKQ